MKENKMFMIASSKMIITDPCYEYDKKTSLVLPVLKGLWLADIERDRFIGIARLTCWHSSSHNAIHTNTLINNDIGVDSGQCGMFDFKNYPKNNTGEANDPESFYGKCCKLTLSNEGWGVLPFGAVSSSGAGDGSYYLFGVKNKDNKYIYLSLYFDEPEEN